MPNHVHGIISLTLSNVGAGFPRPLDNYWSLNENRKGAVTAPLRPPTLGRIVAYFKYQTTKQINQIRQMPGESIWQRNYFEHVIRNEDELNRTRQYILDNPAKWDDDPENV